MTKSALYRLISFFVLVLGVICCLKSNDINDAYCLFGQLMTISSLFYLAIQPILKYDEINSAAKIENDTVYPCNVKQVKPTMLSESSSLAKSKYLIRYEKVIKINWGKNTRIRYKEINSAKGM